MPIRLSAEEREAVEELVDRLQHPQPDEQLATFAPGEAILNRPSPKVSPAIRTASHALGRAQTWLNASTAHQLAGETEKAQRALQGAQREASRASLALDLAVSDLGVDAYVESGVGLIGGGE